MNSVIKAIAFFVFLTYLLTGRVTGETLRFGFLPIFSPEALVKLHKPLKDHLETDLKLHVEMVSSPDFKLFNSRTKNLSYDLIFTAPHLARLAETEYKYQRIAATSHRGSANFLVRADSGIKSIKDLKGLSIALPPDSAIIHHMALRTLRERGIEAGKNIRVITTKSHNDPVLRLLSQMVNSAAIGKAPWARIKEETGDQVIVIGQSVSIPGFMILANPKLPIKRVQAIRKSFIKFGLTPVGKKYLEKSGYKKMVPISDQDMHDMDFYLIEMGMK